VYLSAVEGAAAAETVFKPVQAPTAFEETVERLGSAIRVGLLAPGSRLPPERELADHLCISRSTLRQALTTLVQTGHLVALRGRTGGTFVAADPPLAAGSEPIDADVRATLDWRVAVETGAVLLAAERSEERDLRPLDSLVERMTAASDFDQYRRADVRFHVGIAEAAHSPRLLEEMTEVQGQMSELIDLIAHPDMVLSHSNEEHRRMLTCLRDGDGLGAVQILRHHLAGTEHIIAGLIPAGAAA
jgi:GntR family transcriptional regulator, transcriptional repressor for pyruvate dehydrogenase complex